MSPDEIFLTELLAAFHDVKLEALIVGTTAAVLQGAPVMTQDVDVLIRDTEMNRDKLRILCDTLRAEAIESSPLTRSLRLVGLPIGVDVLFDEIAGGLSFESLRSRARNIDLGGVVATVAALEDVIASKQAAGRPKDQAQLPTLLDTLRVKRALTEEGI